MRIRFIRWLPITDIPASCVVLKPLADVNDTACQVATFSADPDQLSAPVILANYGRETNEEVNWRDLFLGMVDVGENLVEGKPR